MRTVVRLSLSSIVAALFLAVPAFGQVGFLYNVAAGKTTITGYTTFGRPTYMTIPNTLGGGVVVSIGPLAFNNWPSLRSVTIPDSVTNIGERAFEYCPILASVTLGTNVINIGYGAFQNCTTLDCISVPDSVNNLGSFALNSCTALTNAIIGSNVRNIGDYTFYGCSKLTNVLMPDSVTNIGNRAFYNCTNLTNVLIPDNVTHIGSEAFYSCGRVRNIIFPESLNNIGELAFAICTNLTNINIPQNVTNIGKDAFCACFGLKEFMVNASNACYCSVGGVLFNKNRTTLVQYPAQLSGTYTIPTCVSNIEDSAFSGCKNLTGILIPNNVVVIGAAAFDGCTALTSVSIPCGVKTINSGTFSSCSNLTNATISSSVTCIGEFAFFLCSSLSNLYFQGNAPNLAQYVFDGAPAKIYRLSGTTGWPVVPAAWGGRPTALWYPVSLLAVNGGSGSGSWRYGDLVTVSANSLPGYTFDRWIGATQNVANVTAATTTLTMPAQDAFLTALFKGNTYVVTFDAAGGASPSPTSKIVVNGTPYDTLASTTRAGYTFGGWWTGADGKGFQVTSSTTVAIFEAQTLYAKWTLTTTSQGTPCQWLQQFGIVVDGDYESAALADVDLDGYMAWQEYMSGTNPTNRESFFKSMLTVSNGCPVVTWTPNLGTERVYTVEGRVNLSTGSWGMTNESSRFFRVKVDW